MERLEGQQVQITDDLELVLERMVIEHSESGFPFVEYRTLEEEQAAGSERSLELYDLPDEDRAGAQLELALKLLLLDADKTREGDIARDSGLMHSAYVASLEECAINNGITSAEELMRLSDEDHPSVTTEEYDQFAESLGFSRDELLDLRRSCSRHAATLPSLEADVRDDLFRQLRQHYLGAIRAWFADSPDASDSG